jgi:hypothetical protein
MAIVADPMAHLIELLHFSGCPNVEKARTAVTAGIDQAAVAEPVEVRLIEVVDDDDARRLRFLGSPTVRVDGHDVEASASGRDDFGLQCRTYDVEGRLAGSPPAEWISRALRQRGS